MELNITKDILFEIIEHLKEAVYIVNAQGKVVYLNDAASQLEQMPKSDFLGKTIDAVYVNTEFHTHRNSPCLDVLASGEIQENENLEWFTGNGTAINAITNTYPIIENGEILGVYEMAENIADLKKRLIEIGAFPRKRTYRMIYICKDKACLQAAEKRKAIERSLGISVTEEKKQELFNRLEEIIDGR